MHRAIRQLRGNWAQTRARSSTEKIPIHDIIHEEAKEANSQDIRLKIDPGSRVTGMAILHKNKVIWAAEIEHCAESKSEQKCYSAGNSAGGRRYRKTRYRKPRF